MNDRVGRRLTPYLETQIELSLVIHVSRSLAQVGAFEVAIYSDQGRLVADRTFDRRRDAFAYVEAAMRKTRQRDPSALILLERDPDIDDV